LAALGRPGYINLGHGADLAARTSPEALEDHARGVLDAAREAGITYFDAARSYGRAEEFLARWLPGLEPPPVVGSKWGYIYTADWQIDAGVHEVKEHTPENLDRQAAESLELLGGWLRLYQIHSATLESGVLENRAVLERLGELRDGGLLIGLSTSGPGQGEVIRRALEVEVGSAPLFQAVQSTWNLLEPSAGPALAEAHEAGLGVIVKEVVANGRLTPRNPGLVAGLGLAGRDFGLDAVVLAAALRQPWASVVLSGAATPEQLMSNLSAQEVPDDVVAGLPDVAERPGDYWGFRSGLAWT
jgi:aryl-alcohol dehydrogenase-like predicted oxidoreductase